MLYQFGFLPLAAILSYNNPEPVAHKVYIETETQFTECELQENTTYANRRFLCLAEKPVEATPPTPRPLPITK